MRKQYAIGRPAAYAAARPSAMTHFAAILTRALAMPRLWVERRRSLPRLSDHLLRDMGLERGQVEAPPVRPYWRG
jgi:uncharacterized protein YjiS (DUF1127 family)